jgi:PAS domain S-box-containing protein
MGRWLQNLRISRKLAVVITVHLLHATVLLVLTAYGVKAVDASRAWVDGEGFWAKAQKESVVQLLTYAKYGDESNLRMALEQINITLGDRIARLELEKPDPDLDIVRAGFLQARNHPDDLDNMIWLYQVFRNERHINHAIGIWTKAEDEGIERLRVLARDLEDEKTSTAPDQARIDAIVNEILDINAFLEDLEHQFSTTLGDGARFITLVVIWGTTALTILFVGSALVVSSVIARQIAGSLGRVKDGAQRMAAGELGLQLEVEGRDEVARVADAFNTMSTKLAGTISEREEQASALAATLDSTADGILVVNREGKIVQFNRKFQAMWRIPDDVVESRSDSRALTFVLEQLEDPQAFLDKVQSLYADPNADSFDVLHFKDGRVFERYSRPQLVAGENVGRVWSFRDVTESRRAEERRRTELLQAEENRRLREVDTLKSRFINSAAHELRTPMTPIRAELYMLRKRSGELDEKTRIAIDRLGRNLDRLGLLVEDVLEGARLQSGEMVLRREPLRLDELVRECVDSFQAAAETRGLDLSLSVEPVHVEGDAQRLSQVVFNFLNNALRFTPPGGRIAVTVAQADGNAVVRVRDTGAGMPPHKIGELFQPFSQLHAEGGARKSSGTGLGLYISKGIIDLHGGSIGCESAGPGLGSTFHFTLPLVGGERTA